MIFGTRDMPMNKRDIVPNLKIWERKQTGEEWIKKGKHRKDAV